MLCILLATGCLSSIAQVNFRKIELDEALKAAQAEKKLVFVDCFTEWCGPCKKMSNEEFVKPEAGNYFNPKFVCIKVDMEKGKGPDMAKKYSVNAYPTFLILNTDGSLRGRYVGAAEIDKFIDNIEGVLNEEKGLPWFQKKFEAGERDAAFLKGYVSLLQLNYMRNEVKAVTLELLKGKTAADIAADADSYNTFVKGGFGTDDEIFLNIYKERETVSQKQGEKALKQLEAKWMSDGLACLKAEGQVYLGFDQEKFEAYKQKMVAYDVPDQQSIIDNILYSNATYAKDYPTLFKYVERNMKQKDEEINDRKMQQDLNALVKNYQDKKAQKQMRQFITKRIAYLEKKDTSGERQFTNAGKTTTLTGFFIDNYKRLLE